VPGEVRIWLMAARPRTLPAAVAPVLVGTALAGYLHVFHPLRFVAALLGAIFIQVGTNLSNDYSDARRGADAEDRLGPVRVTAGGLVPPRQVLVATYVTFGLAVLAGVYLVVCLVIGGCLGMMRYAPSYTPARGQRRATIGLGKAVAVAYRAVP
jgi:1,4-dihydroxy-2-naphthoate polyprenyltransferase